MSGVGDYLRLVKFSHSIFALPFALQAAWVAAGGMPDARTLLLVVLCCVAARTAAMGFNRLVDRRIDARNPADGGPRAPRWDPARAGRWRSSSRSPRSASSPARSCSTRSAVGSRFRCSRACSATASRSASPWLAHAVLGLCLALAPLGAWLAVSGELTGLATPLLLAGAVLAWVAGFDLIYACQDAAFDQAEGLHSFPARFGVRRALQLSAVLHVTTIALLVVFGLTAGLSWIILGGARLRRAPARVGARPRVSGRPLAGRHGVSSRSTVGSASGCSSAWPSTSRSWGPDGRTQARTRSADAGPRARRQDEEGPRPRLRDSAARSATSGPRRFASSSSARRPWGTTSRGSTRATRTSTSRRCSATSRRARSSRPRAASSSAGRDSLLKTRSKEPTALTRAVKAFLASADIPGLVVLEAETLRADHAAVKAVVEAGGATLSCRKLWDSPPPWDPDPRKAELVAVGAGPRARARRAAVGFAGGLRVWLDGQRPVRDRQPAGEAQVGRQGQAP